MFSYSYNLGGASMSRLDELLNRNQLIYQNLKQKLDGINRSNQNIYRNISHIQTNFSQDPFSQESSAIEREPTIRNTSVRIDNEEPPYKPYPQHLHRIDERQEVTFSQEQLNEGEEEARVQRILQEEQRLYELELRLEKERELEREMEEERLIELEILKRQREDTERQSQREERVRREREDRWREQETREDNQAEFRRQSVTSGEPSDRSKKGFSLQKYQKDSKNAIKNNSIYLSKIPKTSVVEEQGEIPTFRQTFPRNKPAVEEQQPEVKPESSHRAKNSKPQEQFKPESYRGKELRELSTFKVNRTTQEKPKRTQPKKEVTEYQEITDENYPNPLGGSNSIVRDHETSELDLEHTIARSQPRRENTPYQELNSRFKLKLEEIQLIPECILFAPFNKVYRSPILQLKPGCLTLQRKSKTSALTSAGSRTRIVDGLRYKFKTVLTDEQVLLKYLFCSEEELNFKKRECNKIAIVGGREALKKKLHMGLLAYCHQQLAQQVSQTHRSIVIKMEHQAITPNEEPFELQSAIEADPTTRRLALMKLEKMVNDMHDAIKKLHCGKNGNRKVLRMTKLAVLAADGEVMWNCHIISSNRYDFDFLRHLRVNKICWSINPLVKYYDDVKETLESMRYFICNRRTA